MSVPVVVALKRAKRARASSSLGVVVVRLASVPIFMLVPVLLSLGLVSDAADFIADGIPDVVYALQYGHGEVLSH